MYATQKAKLRSATSTRKVGGMTDDDWKNKMHGIYWGMKLAAKKTVTDYTKELVSLKDLITSNSIVKLIPINEYDPFETNKIDIYPVGQVITEFDKIIELLNKLGDDNNSESPGIASDYEEKFKPLYKEYNNIYKNLLKLRDIKKYPQIVGDFNDKLKIFLITVKKKQLYYENTILPRLRNIIKSMQMLTFKRYNMLNYKKELKLYDDVCMACIESYTLLLVMYDYVQQMLINLSITEIEPKVSKNIEDDAMNKRMDELRGITESSLSLDDRLAELRRGGSTRPKSKKPSKKKA